MARSRSAQPAIDPEEAPFFVLLERLGRRVLRPGGRAATRRLLEALCVCPDDDVVELAAGVGATTSEVLSRRPRSYPAVEPTPRFAPALTEALDGPARHVAATAQATGLADASADVVIGEAMLTMQTDAPRRAIVGEAARLLRPCGRYGIHELATRTDDPARVRELQRDLSRAVKVAARPMPADQRYALLQDAGLELISMEEFPLRLLTVRGLLADEGLRGAVRVATRLARWPEVRARVRRTRRVHRRHGASLAATVLAWVTGILSYTLALSVYRCRAPIPATQ